MSTPGPSAPPTKRAAPINSTAFTFSLDTPKAKRPRPLGDFAPGLSSHSLTPAAKAESSASYNPKVTVKPENSALSTPRKVYQSLDALPSPFALRTPAQPRPSHRLNEILDEVSPFRRGEDEKPGERVRLGDLPGQRLTEDVNMGEARRRVVEEDEGIGVSPRRGKNGLRWSGKGPPPAAIELASILASANSSLLLFYTSLQQTLHPSRTFTPARASRPAISNPVSAARHLRSAPIQLRIRSAVSGPTHHAVLFWCEVLAWRTREPIGERREVLVAFQPVPSECPRLGVDPRTVRGRAGEGRLWEVGVWGPWSEVNLGWVRGEALESQGTEVKPEVVEEGARAVDEDAPMGEGKTTRVLLASRYLIAEGEA